MSESSAGSSVKEPMPIWERIREGPEGREGASFGDAVLEVVFEGVFEEEGFFGVVGEGGGFEEEDLEDAFFSAFSAFSASVFDDFFSESVFDFFSDDFFSLSEEDFEDEDFLEGVVGEGGSEESVFEDDFLDFFGESGLSALSVFSVFEDDFLGDSGFEDDFLGESVLEDDFLESVLGAGVVGDSGSGEAVFFECFRLEGVAGASVVFADVNFEVTIFPGTFGASAGGGAASSLIAAWN